LSTAAATNPRHDAAFVDRCINDLLDHPRQWRQLGRLYAGDMCLSYERCLVTRDAVAVARRLGFVIEGDKLKGYRFVRWERPRYVHLSHAAAWPPEPRLQRDEDGIAGQLSLVECDS